MMKPNLSQLWILIIFPLLLTSCVYKEHSGTNPKANQLLKQLTPFKPYPLYLKNISGVNKKKQQVIQQSFKKSLPFPYITSKKGLGLSLSLSKNKNFIVYTWKWDSIKKESQKNSSSPSVITHTTQFNTLNASWTDSLLKQVTLNMIAKLLPYLPKQDPIPPPSSRSKAKNAWYFQDAKGDGSKNLKQAFLGILKQKHLPTSKSSKAPIHILLKIQTHSLDKNQVDITITWTIHFIPTGLTAHILQHNVMSLKTWHETYKNLASAIAGLAFNGLIQKLNVESKA